MANMDVTQRRQLERKDLLAGGEAIRHGAERASRIYSVVALIVAAILASIAIATIDSWAQWLVLGAIIVTTIGFMIAISPNRRA